MTSDAAWATYRLTDVGSFTQHPPPPSLSLIPATPSFIVDNRCVPCGCASTDRLLRDSTPCALSWVVRLPGARQVRRRRVRRDPRGLRAPAILEVAWTLYVSALVPLHAVAQSTACLCVLGADRCLQSNGMANSVFYSPLYFPPFPPFIFPRLPLGAVVAGSTFVVHGCTATSMKIPSCLTIPHAFITVCVHPHTHRVMCAAELPTIITQRPVLIGC